jgi:hypothetical protein
MHAIMSFNNELYQPLADITWHQNKKIYAKLYSYETFYRNDNFRLNSNIGYQKIYDIKDIMETRPDIEWIWVTGADSLITNFSIKIEDKIDNRYHFMISVDYNNINSDSFLIRNTPEGKSLIDYLIQVEEAACKEWDTDQRALAWALGIPTSGNVWPNIPYYPVSDRFKNIAKIYPQTYMNSYNYDLYIRYMKSLNPAAEDYDVFGYRGNWKKGDWLIHWPGISLEERIVLANIYIHRVIL